MNTTSKIRTISGQKRFQGATQARQTDGIVPQLSEGGSGRKMVSIEHMQKARVRKLHMIAHGGRTGRAVSGPVDVRRTERSIHLGMIPKNSSDLGHFIFTSWLPRVTKQE